MGKATKTNRKKYEIKLSVPDQRHLSYLSDGHAIHNSARMAKNEPFQNFESYLLDAIFKQANQDIGQYAAYLKARQEQDKAAEQETEESVDAQDESGDTEPETTDAAE